MASDAPTATGIPTSDNWPSFAEELSRKTTEQLQIWTDRYDRGVISLSAMISIVSVLYDTTSGLVERDVSTLLADLHKDLLREVKAKA